MKKTRFAHPIRKTRLILAFFILALLSPLYSSNTQCEWTGVKKIVAVGDLHGDYDSFVDILKGTRLVELVDNKPHWTGGKTHLVQIGDVMDRGNKAKDILDLLMRLETEAEQAGGKVHFLLGNHEEMNITGIAIDNKEYVTLNQFISFLPESYREREEIKIREDYAKKLLKGPKPELTLEQSINNYWEAERNKAIADPEYQARKEYTRNFRERYGKWLVEHNAVIKIDDIVFVHGGISEKFSTWKLEEINNRLCQELKSFIRENPIEDLQVVYDRNGPLWYRDLALPQIKEEDIKPEVDRILQNLGARYMVVAHTPRLIKTKADMTRFDGRIWVIDTGISYVYRSGGGRQTALIIEETGNDIKFSVWPFDFNEESTKAIEQTRYLQEGMATKARQILEFIASILRDALRMGIYYRGEQ
jgi:calcineurin-like phosphoesterase family protein